MMQAPLTALRLPDISLDWPKIAHGVPGSPVLRLIRPERGQGSPARMPPMAHQKKYLP
jgi:hypothetical protein